MAPHRRRGGAEFPDVTIDYLHVDAATIFLVTDPARFDVIVTDNLFGDILTDLAAAITGGIGLAASGNINPERTRPACSSRCTARPPTSPARARPTRPRPCCRSPCCSSTWACRGAAARVEEAVAADLAERAEATSRPSTREVGDASPRASPEPLPGRHHPWPDVLIRSVNVRS